eukprot:GHVU01000139.1.p1 GENE.GHVU01000139.1~~GHVU01000139.1.p1  ORF type:complete len:116 (-),score=17.00 GHVU01000139.1:43-390(-)
MSFNMLAELAARHETFVKENLEVITTAMNKALEKKRKKPPGVDKPSSDKTSEDVSREHQWRERLSDAYRLIARTLNTLLGIFKGEPSPVMTKFIRDLKKDQPFAEVWSGYEQKRA